MAQQKHSKVQTVEMSILFWLVRRLTAMLCVMLC